MEIFVFSSTSETQGMVLAEAMAAGVPVIALEAFRVREVVRDNHNGRLLPENATHRLFAQAVSDYFENMENAHSWKKAAISTAHEFSREASAERLIRMYRTLLQEESRDEFANKDILDPWDKLLISLKTKWTLLSEKADVIRRAVRKEYKKDRQGNDPAQ